jgi:hypothetical protein
MEVRWTWRCSGRADEGYCLSGRCGAEYRVRNFQSFRKIFLPPCSGLKLKWSKRIEIREVTCC